MLGVTGCSVHTNTLRMQQFAFGRHNASHVINDGPSPPPEEASIVPGCLPTCAARCCSKDTTMSSISPCNRQGCVRSNSGARALAKKTHRTDGRPNKHATHPRACRSTHPLNNHSRPTTKAAHSTYARHRAHLPRVAACVRPRLPSARCDPTRVAFPPRRCTVAETSPPRGGRL